VKKQLGARGKGQAAGAKQEQELVVGEVKGREVETPPGLITA
jgi:hypothetical protein